LQHIAIITFGVIAYKLMWLGRVGSRKMDPWTILVSAEAEKHRRALSCRRLNEVIADSRLRYRCAICCRYIRRQSNSVATPDEYVGDFDYLLQHADHVDIANATRHV